MFEPLYLITIGLPFLTILIVFAMRSYAQVQQARAKMLTEDAYRQVVERAVATQAESGAALTAIQADVAEIKTRLAAVEKILKAVE